MQLELSLELEYKPQPGDRIITASGRRGVVVDPAEVGKPRMQLYSLIRFDGQVMSQWIKREAIKPDNEPPATPARRGRKRKSATVAD